MQTAPICVLLGLRRLLREGKKNERAGTSLHHKHLQGEGGERYGVRSLVPNNPETLKLSRNLRWLYLSHEARSAGGDEAVDDGEIDTARVAAPNLGTRKGRGRLAYPASTIGLRPAI